MARSKNLSELFLLPRRWGSCAFASCFVILLRFHLLVAVPVVAGASASGSDGGGNRSNSGGFGGGAFLLNEAEDVPTQQMQDYLVRLARDLAAEEKQQHRDALLFTDRPGFMAFHDRFFQRLKRRLASEVCQATRESLLGRLGARESPSLVRKILEFYFGEQKEWEVDALAERAAETAAAEETRGGTGGPQGSSNPISAIPSGYPNNTDSQVIFSVPLPAAVLSVPGLMVERLWAEEIEIRRAAWRETGRKLTWEKIAAASKEFRSDLLIYTDELLHGIADGSSSIRAADWLQKWLREYPDVPSWIRGRKWKRTSEVHLLRELMQVYEKLGYKIEGIEVSATRDQHVLVLRE